MSTITIGLLAILLGMLVMTLLTLKGMKRNEPVLVLLGAGFIFLLSSTGVWWYGSLQLTEEHGLSWLTAPIRALRDPLWIAYAIIGCGLLVAALGVGLHRALRAR